LCDNFRQRIIDELVDSRHKNQIGNHLAGDVIELIGHLCVGSNIFEFLDIVIECCGINDFRGTVAPDSASSISARENTDRFAAREEDA